METINQDIKPHIKVIVDQLDAQIAEHQKIIDQLTFTRNMWIKHQPEPVQFFHKNEPLTRDLIRRILRGYGQPVQTVQLINLLYSDLSETERTDLTKHMAVILHQMAAAGELYSERRSGVKGNFYTWNRQNDGQRRYPDQGNT